MDSYSEHEFRKIILRCGAFVDCVDLYKISRAAEAFDAYRRRANGGFGLSSG